MAILDYSGILGRPFQGAGQTAIQTAQGLQGMRANEQIMQRQTQQDQQAQQAAQAETAARQQGAELLQNGTPDDIAAFGIKNPNVMKDFIASANFKDQTALGTRVKYAQNVLGGNVSPREALDARILEVESAGGDASGLRKTAELDDDGIRAAAEKDLAVIAPKMYESYKKATGGGDKVTLSAEASSFNELIKDFSPEEQKTARRVKAGLKGRAMTNAELSAIESGDIKSYSDYKIKQKQAEKFAEATGAQRAKLIDKGFETITKIDGSVRNIDRAIAALDKGAGVGVFEKMWPSIAAASVELDNIRNAMALDVVGATTFGALSAGELALAKDVALPTGLDTKELIEYLGKKKAAQQKLRDYYNEQVQFLDQGGTVAGFLRSKEDEQSQQGGNNQDQQALDWANANPDDPRAAQILNKLRG